MNEKSFLLPVEIATVVASGNGLQDFMPKSVIPNFVTPIVVDCVEWKKSGKTYAEGETDFRITLDVDGQTIKTYASTLKGLWDSTKHKALDLFEELWSQPAPPARGKAPEQPELLGFTLRPDFVIRYLANTGADKDRFPYRCEADKR